MGNQLIHLRKEKGKNQHPNLDKLCYGMPFFIIGLIWAGIFLSPEFFLTYVLSEANREFQLLEIVTFLAALSAGVLLVFSALKMWKIGWHLASAVVLVNAGATLFFAGEEISWGQSYFFWKTPDWWNAHIAYETNFHNSQISVGGFHAIAGLYQLMMFGVLPCMGLFQNNFPIVRLLYPAIPEWPIVSFVVVGFIYRECKNIYMWLYPHDKFFQDFIWGINEHREMLMAIALLFYAIYRLKILQNLSSNERKFPAR